MLTATIDTSDAATIALCEQLLDQAANRLKQTDEADRAAKLAAARAVVDEARALVQELRRAGA